MVVVMFAEFPSGVVADIFSRKTIYILSILVNFFSYIIIGFCKGNFILLIIAYILYGLALALKSGTLDAEIVLEYRKEEVKSYIKGIKAEEFWNRVLGFGKKNKKKQK